jgi:hypothetical protein
MTGARPVATPPITWAVAGRAHPGEQQSGDLHVVAPYAGGVLVAVIDGLGHGPEAAAAARLAAAVLENRPTDSPLDLVRECHRQLHGSRGAVMSLAAIDDSGAMTWIGTGNVEGVLVRATSQASDRMALPLRGGIVGVGVLRPAASTEQLLRNDILVLATYGIRGEFISAVDASRAPHALADAIVARFARDADDALVLAARFEGTRR